MTRKSIFSNICRRLHCVVLLFIDDVSSFWVCCSARLRPNRIETDRKAITRKGRWVAKNKYNLPDQIHTRFHWAQANELVQNCVRSDRAIRATPYGLALLCSAGKRLNLIYISTGIVINMGADFGTTSVLSFPICPLLAVGPKVLFWLRT